MAFHCENLHVGSKIIRTTSSDDSDHLDLVLSLGTDKC